MIVVGLCSLVWVPAAISDFNDALRGTSENISVEVTKAPFVESPSLVYRWRGDVVRSCRITMLRSVIGADGVVTVLEPKSFPPEKDLGHKDFHVTIPMPNVVAAGPATYRAEELAWCSWVNNWIGPAHSEWTVSFAVEK